MPRPTASERPRSARAGTVEPLALPVAVVRRAMPGTVHAGLRGGTSDRTDPHTSPGRGYPRRMATDATDPNALPWTRVGAYAICTDAQDRLLVCRLAPGYPSTGLWTLPGGGVEFGEHPDAAVIRELREETGLEGAIERIALVTSSTFPKPSSRPGPLHAVAILYRVRVTGGRLTVEVGGSTDGCEWLSVTAIRVAQRVSLVDAAIAWLARESSPGVGEPAAPG